MERLGLLLLLCSLLTSRSFFSVHKRSPFYLGSPYEPNRVYLASLLTEEKPSSQNVSSASVFRVFTTGSSIQHLKRLPEFEHSYEEFELPKLNAWQMTIASDRVPSSSERSRADVQEVEVPPALMTYLKTRHLSAAHEEKVLELWLSLKNRGSIRKFSEDDKQRVIMALRVAYVAFWGKRTLKSLEILINRSRGTAAILGELRATPEVVIAGILHDIFYDVHSTEYASALRSYLVHLFGEETIKLVESYSMLPNFMARKAEYTLIHSENQIQMLVVSASDYRALYIRIADRLHNLRVLRSLPIDDIERHKIAQEALNVYAPLAHKMGIIKVKGELEDLAFRVLDPELFQKCRYTQTAAHKAFHEASETIQNIMATDLVLQLQNVTYRLTSRVKDKYQLALKMKRKGLKSTNDVKDVLGLRIITETPQRDNESETHHGARGKAICYHIVSRLRNLAGWTPGEFKDYIRHSKENGYESLHLFIKNVALGTNVEVQIRTRQMHISAELGEAAHWCYKDHLYRAEIANSKYYRIAWRSPEQLRAKSSAELIALAKKQIQARRVFVFLNDQATVLNLRKNATALDAAFAIHTEIGLGTRFINIHGNPSAFDRTLQNGDVISVTFNRSCAVAQPSWLKLVRLSHSQSVLRKFFREQQQCSMAVRGCAQLLIIFATNKDIIYRRFGGSYPTGEQIEKYALSRLGLQGTADLLQFLGISAEADVALAIGKLLDVPPEHLSVFTSASALLRSKKLKEYDWNGSCSHLRPLASLLNYIMEKSNIPSIQERWLQMTSLNLEIQRLEQNTTISRKITEFQNPFSRVKELSPSSQTPKMRLKSDILKAQKPFSLEAPTLKAPLRALAKNQVATSIHKNDHNCSGVDYSPHQSQHV